jgi:CubicO group peptidase (beta-lactamase class C family)
VLAALLGLTLTAATGACAAGVAAPPAATPVSQGPSELIGPGARGSGDEQPPAPSAAAIDAYMAAAVKREGLKGAAVIIGRVDRRGRFHDLVRGYYGDYGPDTLEPVASVTKWISTAVVASVVDEGKLAFDDPLSARLPGVPADKGSITVRQAMSHLSGIPAQPIGVEAGHADLAQSSTQALGLPLKGQPGKVFVYSGSAMQVGGRVAEVATGEDFRTLFQKRIAIPLEMKQTRFSAFSQGRGSPALGGDLVSTPVELERFTQMMAGRGRWNGKRVLSEAVVADMARLIGQDAEPIAVPRMAQRYPGMGTGFWCERVAADGRCRSIAAIGAFGSYTWVDYERGLYGVMFVKDEPIKILKHWRAVRAAAERIPTGAAR